MMTRPQRSENLENRNHRYLRPKFGQKIRKPTVSATPDIPIPHLRLVASHPHQFVFFFSKKNILKNPSFLAPIQNVSVAVSCLCTYIQTCDIRIFSASQILF
jgi:hypothetical protein